MHYPERDICRLVECVEVGNVSYIILSVLTNNAVRFCDINGRVLQLPLQATYVRFPFLPDFTNGWYILYRYHTLLDVNSLLRLGSRMVIYCVSRFVDISQRKRFCSTMVFQNWSIQLNSFDGVFYFIISRLTNCLTLKLIFCFASHYKVSVWHSMLCVFSYTNKRQVCIIK